MSATSADAYLKANTAVNASTTDAKTILKKVYLVWKYTGGCQQKQFAKKVNKTIWRKVEPFKELKDLTKSNKNLQVLWIKIKTTKDNTPVPALPTVADLLKDIILARDKWTREDNAIQAQEITIRL